MREALIASIYRDCNCESKVKEYLQRLYHIDSAWRWTPKCIPFLCSDRNVTTYQQPVILSEFQSLNTIMKTSLRVALKHLLFGVAIVASSNARAEHTDEEGYCIPPFTQDTYVGLTKVSLNGEPALLRESIAKEFYTNTGEETSLTTGNFYKMSATAITSISGQAFQSNVVVWIDWNQDKDFDDAGEEIGRWTRKTGSLVPFDFQVPADAAAGPTRMRVYCDMTDEMAHPLPTPCGYEEFGEFKLGHHGEVEDYTVNVIGGSNANPTLDIGKTLSARVGKAFDAFVSATDPDGDLVYFDVLEKPTWLSWSDSTANAKEGLRLYGTPAVAGSYEIKLLVADDRGAQKQETITIVATASPKPTEPQLLAPTHANEYRTGDTVKFIWTSSFIAGSQTSYDLKLQIGSDAPVLIRNLMDTAYTWVVPAVNNAGGSVMVNWLITAYERGDANNKIASKGQSFMIETELAGVNEEGIDYELAIAPNPAARKVTLESTQYLESVSIINAAGVRVSDLPGVTGKKLEIEVSALSSGTYTVIVVTKSGVTHHRQLQVVK